MYGNVDEAPPYITIIDFKEDVVCVVTARCQISLDATEYLSSYGGRAVPRVETLDVTVRPPTADIASWLGLAATEHRIVEPNVAAIVRVFLSMPEPPWELLSLNCQNAGRDADEITTIAEAGEFLVVAVQFDEEPIDFVVTGIARRARERGLEQPRFLARRSHQKSV